MFNNVKKREFNYEVGKIERKLSSLEDKLDNLISENELKNENKEEIIIEVGQYKVIVWEGIPEDTIWYIPFLPRELYWRIEKDNKTIKKEECLTKEMGIEEGIEFALKIKDKELVKVKLDDEEYLADKKEAERAKKDWSKDLPFEFYDYDTEERMSVKGIKKIIINEL